ncbi:MAG: hypothetical protein IH974_00830 [Myxococcales bacterium]|nr:hypothetical protein [Myxococcales bacterium]
MRLTVFAAAVGNVAALVGFAGAANASATIDLIWDATGTNEISDLVVPTTLTLNVILTAGPNGSQAAGVSVDYSTVFGQLVVLGFASTPGGPLPILLGSTIDTGTRVENINSAALPPHLGTGLAAGQSHQLGTVTFDTSGLIGNMFEIPSDADGPVDGVFDLAGNNITPTATFNSAFLVPHGDPDFFIEINTLRGGSPTVTVNTTKKITAKARIPKGTAESDTTCNTTLRIDAVDGQKVIDTQNSGPIRLEVGKGGRGDTLTMNINQCNSGSIVFIATFFGTDVNCALVEATRTITKTCK